MIRNQRQSFLVLSGCVMAAAWLSLGCASNRSSGKHEVRMEQEAVVTVEEIDVPHRLVTVRNASGVLMTVYVDESVKSFPQASVGDKVHIRFVESIGLELKKTGDTKAIEITEETARPQPGRPGATSTEVKATVRIEAVEQRGNTVTFTGPRGRRTVRVHDKSVAEFARGLRPGDFVEVTYREALALSLEKVRA